MEILNANQASLVRGKIAKLERDLVPMSPHEQRYADIVNELETLEAAHDTWLQYGRSGVPLSVSILEDK